jgi:hypothetical protein
MTENSLMVRAEDLRYWYLRLNGCFTIPNFVVHPDSGTNQKTDIDVLAARFPLRGDELPVMKDDTFFESCRTQTLVLLTEIKNSRCSLNRTWLDPEGGVLAKVLRAAGMFPMHEVVHVAAALVKTGHYCSQLHRVSFLAIGGEIDDELQTRYPEMPQILWPVVLTFIHARFRAYRRQKRSHPQWDRLGQQLWNLADSVRDPAKFAESVRVVENLAEPDAPRVWPRE